MARLSNVSFCLLGKFAIDANVGRPIAVTVRSKKARALLAYLAMRPDYQVRREELATLFWGDNSDALARHSLRQCLISLRQDLCLASEILVVSRETVALNRQLVSVDARSFVSLAGSSRTDDLARAAELWRGAFLPDLSLDLEEFDAWQRRESDRLAAAASGVFEALCRSADANRDGNRAMAAAERLVELDPTREDWQRTALLVCARYKGRETALARAKMLADLLREELGVAPEAATRALIAKIERGDFEPALTRDREQADAPDSIGPPAPVVEPLQAAEPLEAAPPSLSVDNGAQASSVAPAMSAAPLQFDTKMPRFLGLWHRVRPAVWASVGVLLVGVVAASGIAAGSKFWPWRAATQLRQGIVVLPFAADRPARPDDPAFARLLTHDLIGYLSRFSELRVISEPTSNAYGSRRNGPDLAADLDVQYAIVGNVEGNDSDLKIDFQLVDTATRTNVWSDNVQRQRSDSTLIADETARGIARAMVIEIDRRAAVAMRAKPSSELTLGQLVGRGYLALQRGTTRENLAGAMKSFNEALRRDPRYRPALLAVARVQIIATNNFIDLNPAPDLDATERVLNQDLDKFPNSLVTLYSLALLQKHRRQYEASIRTLQRCLEINPSFLPAQGQIGDILVRTGQAQKGLDQILQTIRAATPSDPTLGYWYLFVAEAELQLGHDRTALDWALRADILMPRSPLVQAWLASIYANTGDAANAARYVAVLSKMAPERTKLFLAQPANNPGGVNNGSRIFQGLRLALSASPG
jgi:DNA-binding SARP family transcriptional activator/TolB-like protein